MQFHYDVSAAEPIIRDTRIYDAGSDISIGTAMCHGPVATAENCGAAIMADPDVMSNIIGVMNESVTAANALSVVAAGTDKYGKIIINPLAVWLAKVSQLAADDTVTSTTTGDTLTGTCVTDHERGWAYVTNVGDGSNGGYGNLFQIGASTSTTAIVAATTTAASNLRATSTSDTFIVLPPPYSADVAGGGLDLADNVIDLSGYAGTGAGAIVPLENYIMSNSRPLEVLVAAKHSGFNFRDEAPQFYVDIMFPEHLLLGGKVNDRVID